MIVFDSMLSFAAIGTPQMLRMSRGPDNVICGRHGHEITSGIPWAGSLCSPVLILENFQEQRPHYKISTSQISG